MTSMTGTITYPPPRHDQIVPGLVPWAKAGIIVKDGVRPGSQYAALMMTGGHGVRFQHDYEHDVAGNTGGVSAQSPRWLRLTRSGDTISGAESADGKQWRAVGSATLRGLPDTMQVVYDFPGCTLTYSMRKGNGLKLNGHEYGILFCGTDGSLMLDRAGYEIIPDKTVEPYGIKSIHPELKARPINLEAEKVKGEDGQPPHIKNFLACLSSRDRPICDIEIGHHSTNTCHLGNIAYKLGRKLVWDQSTETFKGDLEANALLAREPRRGYELPNI
jgi:hypothetical protein